MFLCVECLVLKSKSTSFKLSKQETGNLQQKKKPVLTITKYFYVENYKLQ